MRSLLIGLVLAAALVACSGGDDDVAVDTSSAEPAPSPANTSATSAPTPAPTVAATTLPAVPEATTPDVTTPDVTTPVETMPAEATTPPATGIPASDLDDLTLYWGFISALTAGDTYIATIDVVEVYFGEQAVAEGAADSIEVPADVEPVIYVRNDDPAPVVLQLAAEVSITLQGCDYGQGPVGDCSNAAAGTIAELPVETGELILLQLSGGLVTRIDVPFFP